MKNKTVTQNLGTVGANKEPDSSHRRGVPRTTLERGRRANIPQYQEVQILPSIKIQNHHNVL
jgi:hypothetical protein